MRDNTKKKHTHQLENILRFFFLDKKINMPADYKVQTFFYLIELTSIKFILITQRISQTAVSYNIRISEVETIRTSPLLMSKCNKPHDLAVYVSRHKTLRRHRQSTSHGQSLPTCR